MSTAIRILQLTDLHLFSSPHTTLIGLNPYNSLTQVVAKVKTTLAYHSPSLLVLSGDVSQDYSPESYHLAAELCATFPCPTLALMGNHDHPTPFTATFGAPNKTWELNNWGLILLNTHYPEHVGGHLDEEALEFLHHNLIKFRNHQVIIFLHHQILPVGSSWLDNIKVNNPLQFLEIIAKFANIKAVICGHVHQESATSRAGISYLTTPATSWQFAVRSPDFKLDTLMPGYRWLDLYPDGSFATVVERIEPNNKFVPDLDSTGY